MPQPRSNDAGAIGTPPGSHVVDSPTPKQVSHRAAKTYLAAGLSLIPIRADGTKMPAIELLPRVWSEEAGKYRRPWGGYRKQRPTLDEVRAWFLVSYTARAYGMAILGGAISGQLEIIDLDNWGVVEPWTRLVEEKSPGLLERLVQVKTPRPGLHVYYRCEASGGNQKLARVPDPAQDNRKPKTLIEVKGEGGYCLAPPSPAACHRSGRCYTCTSTNDLTKVPTITAAERQVLHDCGRALNCWQRPRRPGCARRPRPGAAGRFVRPGDDYNARADWADLLERHGWSWNGTDGDGADYWCRPGKTCGTSATANFGGSDLLFVFSSNAAPFEDGTAYSKFHAYALLEHHGNFHAAARALRGQGYGVGGRPRPGRDANPFERYARYPRRVPGGHR